MFLLRTRAAPQYEPVRPYFNVVVRPKAPAKKNLVAALRAMPLPVVERYAAEHDVTVTEAKRLWAELALFLLLSAANPYRRYGMFGPVDAMWHNFILHTQDYARFCEEFIGAFMHHFPCRTPSGAKWESRYLQFLFDYREIYNHAPPDDLWPIPAIDGVDSASLPRAASTVTPGHIKLVFERLNGPLRETAIGPVAERRRLNRKKRGRYSTSTAENGCGSGGGPSGSDSGGGDGGGGCGGGGCSG